MMNLEDKYKPLLGFVQKKEQANYFFNLGLFLRPFHGILEDGSCSCKNLNCDKPGKHPILPKMLYCKDIKSFEKILVKHPYCQIALATGYYPMLKRSLVVVDVDDLSYMEKIQSILPSVNETFAVETKKGKHFYFWVDGIINSTTNKNINWINTIIQFQGMKVDILGQKRSVLAPGSANKTITNNLPIATLSPQETNKIKQNIINNRFLNLKQTKTSVNSNTYQIVPKDLNKKEIIRMFYNKEIKHGGFNQSLCLVSCEQLRKNKEKIVKNLYREENHVHWLLNKAIKYLPQPVNLKQVEQVAKNNFKNFNPNKTQTIQEIFESVFKEQSNTIKAKLKQIFKLGFQKQTIEKEEDRRDNNWCGTSVSDLRKAFNVHVKAMGIKEQITVSDKELIIFLSEFHSLDKRRSDKIKLGKRITKTLWNIKAFKAIVQRINYSLSTINKQLNSYMNSANLYMNQLTLVKQILNYPEQFNVGSLNFGTILKQ
jgi:hypothetical protein